MSEKGASSFKIVLASSFGGGLEMYDFVIYIFFTPIIAQLFFSNISHFIAMLTAFAVFAAGYLVRPLGGIIFGHFGDRVGRKTGLIVSISMMGLCTILIGCLPTYAQIGVLAPILLIILRLLQGIAVGGDLPGAMTFVSEMAPPKSRGEKCAWIYFGVNFGTLLASAVASLLVLIFNKAQMHNYGWRCAFIFGAVILFVGIYMRRNMDESKLFRMLQNTASLNTFPLRSVLNKKHIGSIILGIGLVWLWAVILGQIFLYMPTYLHVQSGISMKDALFYNTINLVIFTVLIPLFGRISDHYGRKRIGLLTCIGWVLLSYPAYTLIISHYTFAGLLIFAVLSAAFIGIAPAMLTELFPTALRYTAIGVSYNVSFAIFAGLTPLLLTYLIGTFHSPMVVTLNIIVAGLVGFLTIGIIPDRATQVLP